MTFTDVNPVFNVTSFLKLNISKTYGQSYYRIVTVKPSNGTTYVTSDPDFKVATFFEVEYLNNGVLRS